MGPELIRIKASAGAGKTYMLATRYLKLLERLGSPSADALGRIVAITFTNRAASEMKERILSFLKEIALETPRGRALSREVGLKPERASEWVEVIISNFSDFHVRTIDSLLFAILKGLSFEVGLRPDMEVVFSYDPVLERAFGMVLSELVESKKSLLKEALRTFFELDGRSGFYPEPGLRRRVLEIFKKTGGDVKKREIDLGSVDARTSQVMGFFRGRFLEVFNKVKPFLNGRFFKGLSSVESPHDLLGRSFIGMDPDKLFKNKVDVPGDVKRCFREVHGELKEKLRAFLEALPGLAFSKVGGYVPILSELGGRVVDVCMEEGIILGGKDWTDRARMAIDKSDGTIPLVYAHFGSDFYHFLFDEFQDTSRDQWNALFPIVEDVLSRGGSLFLVGDVKQAIYGWRGGDWTLFDEVVSSFPSVESPKTYELKKNYRSRGGLVRFFNRLFEPLSRKEDIGKILGELFFRGVPARLVDGLASSISSAFSSCRQIPVREDGDSDPCFRIYRCGSWGCSRDELRNIVKSRLLEDLRHEWDRRPRDSGVPMAVLVRTNEDVEEVSSWLIEAGIPVVTEGALKLSSSSVVKGIVSFLSYLYDPADELSLYGFLASGLLEYGPSSEEELGKLWLERRADSWKDKVDSLRERLSPLLNRRSPYEIVVVLLEELGVDLGSGGGSHHAPFIRRFLELTHMFELENGPSISKFLSFWMGGGLEEKVGLPETVDAVRVLTIHKAKGLEFPVVFIPFTDWSPRDVSPVVKTEDGSLVQLMSRYCISGDMMDMRFRLIARELQELINLFYVAVTRAMERVYIFVTLRKGGSMKPISFLVDELVKRGGFDVSEIR